ncbi:TonB family protein [Gracilimonas sp.]|uniref:TonB family protein n=1 Tax=Gracilimonas sp. TaxID=1974203 RepID=UPI002870C700|nr:TonB family protein [Gracilimonas sp.]
MIELVYYIKQIGNFSLDAIWFPLGVWTLCCGLAFLVLRNREKLNPLFHYHLRTAALLSLPFGIGVAALMNRIPTWFAESNIETAFIVVQNPIEVVPAAANSSATVTINWLEPSLLIGIGTVIVGLISLFMIGQLVKSYVTLKSLYKNLEITELQDVISKDLSNDRLVKLAFHDHPLVPFTFGWKQPVIVLPSILQHEPEKLDMALQHELTHIKRGDYLLQLALSMIESLFWFHPLVRYGNQEIDTYREISCDQEVLSKSDFSIKSYANLLYELVPLSSGAGKLSVSMAVKNSTLKKRIKTMKYHKLQKTSFRQSIAFLMLMIVGITLPIACSDLRAPQGLSEEELANTELNFNSPNVTVNGIEVLQMNSNIDAMAFNGMVMILGEYGSFVFAPSHFDGAVKAGNISGNKATFEVNKMTVEITTNEDISDKKIPIYARHFTLDKALDFKIFTKIPNQILTNAQRLKDFGTLTNVPVNLSADLKLSGDLKQNTTEEDFFVVVEQMPKLIGGMAGLQSKVQYPTLARRAGIEGRVTIQFIVTENGNVENARVVRGIGGGADEEALRVVREAKFEPGMQRGRPVRVQYALNIKFNLEDSGFTVDQESAQNTMVVNAWNNDNGTIKGTVKSKGGDFLAGANVTIQGTNIGSTTGPNGEFTIENIPDGRNFLEVSYVGYEKTSFCITGCN